MHASHSLVRSTGFILEGFPSNTDEVEYLLQQQLFPDLVLIMEANIVEVQKRLLPSYLDQWRKWQRHLEEQITVLRQLRLKNRVSKLLHGIFTDCVSSCALISSHFPGGEHGQKTSRDDGRVRSQGRHNEAASATWG